MPAKPTYTPEEIDTMTKERVKLIKETAQELAITYNLDFLDMINAEAVLEDYANGMKLHPGMVKIYFGGKAKTDWIEWDKEVVGEMCTRWMSMPGERANLWIECVRDVSPSLGVTDSRRRMKWDSIWEFELRTGDAFIWSTWDMVVFNNLQFSTPEYSNSNEKKSPEKVCT